MKGESLPLVPKLRRLFALAPVLATLGLTGCSGSTLFQKTETIEEGPIAARREAEADVLAQLEAGHFGSEGTDSSIPSLVPGEGRVLLPAAPAPPATAPPEDKFDNDNAGHRLARCRDRAARQQWFDAIGDCRRSYELNPASIEPQVELMRLLVTLQSYADAEESARKVLAAKPGDPVALYYLAWAYRGRDQYPKAIAALQRAVAASPKRVEFVQALGMTYCQSENFGKGIETLEQALAMQPGDAKLQAMINEARAQLSERLAPYQKLVREKPESYDNHAALGFIYQKYGVSQRAVKAYDSALTKMPSPLPDQDAETKKLAAQIYYNRGVVYRDLARPDLGEPALWQSMQLDPTLAAVAWYYIGLCRYDTGKFDTSIEALQRSIELAPDVADNRAALADAYEKTGKEKLAVEQRNAVAAIDAREVEAKAAIAREEAMGGKTAEENAAGPAAAAPAAEASAQPALAPDADVAAPALGTIASPPAGALAPAANMAAPVPAPPPPPADVLAPLEDDPQQDQP